MNYIQDNDDSANGACTSHFHGQSSQSTVSMRELNSSVNATATASNTIEAKCTVHLPRKIPNRYDVSSTMSRLSEHMVGNQMTQNSVARSNTIVGAESLDISSDYDDSDEISLPSEHDRKRNHGFNYYCKNHDEECNLVTQHHKDQSHNQVNFGGGVNTAKNDDDDDGGGDDDDVYNMKQKKQPLVNYDTFQSDNNQYSKNNHFGTKKTKKMTKRVKKEKDGKKGKSQKSIAQSVKNAFHQIPSVALIAMFHLMIGIPFGVSYFPIGWREASQYNDASPSLYSKSSAGDSSSSSNNGFIDGPFPIEGKNALGIRMFLFSTILGQIVFTFKSGFKNPIGLNMVENVPFCQALATITIQNCGYGIEALSTLFVMFGLSSIVVGVVFYILGKFQLGRIIYFFPSHVLVGLIAGIGIFICKTGVEVTMNSIFSFDSVFENYHLLLVVLGFELLLRLLEMWNVKYGTNGKPVFSLLSPIYFCSITPIFYGILWMIGVSVSDAEQHGYFFPSLVGRATDDDRTTSSDQALTSFLNNTIFNKDVFDIWRIIDFKNVSWAAIRSSIPTLIAITIFSLIHVPINIPAFAISTNSEYDMNKELIAHGYSNCLSGLFGGLQNYMAYTQSILYDRSGGYGKPSGVAVAIVTSILFFFGPTIASAIPRCMAGTLLLHVGIDLFLEGVYDTVGKFEQLEYAGIWLIALVMTFSGMDSAMIAGAIAAVSTYAVQTVAYLDPVRGHMSAATLRSSQRNLGFEANAILDSIENGRSRILVIQLQGHLFFGNVSQLNQSFNDILSSSKGNFIQPLIVIVDFSLVLGIDSSAAQAIVKLKKLMIASYNTKLCVFVPGSTDGFPCEYNLSNELNDGGEFSTVDDLFFRENVYTDTSNEETAYLMKKFHNDEQFKYEGSQVCQTLDFALALSESALIAWQDSKVLQNIISSTSDVTTRTSYSEEDEKVTAYFFIRKICSRSDVSEDDVKFLFSYFKREVHKKDELIWRQGSPSDCAKLLVSGKLIAMLENEAGTYETVQVGRMCGELGLVAGTNRMNSLYCLSDEAILYSISCKSFQELAETNPKVARIMDLICIDYLADRVQHVSNRIFETRCLPI